MKGSKYLISFIRIKVEEGVTEVEKPEENAIMLKSEMVPNSGNEDGILFKVEWSVLPDMEDVLDRLMGGGPSAMPNPPFGVS